MAKSVAGNVVGKKTPISSKNAVEEGWGHAGIARGEIEIPMHRETKKMFLTSSSLVLSSRPDREKRVVKSDVLRSEKARAFLLR